MRIDSKQQEMYTQGITNSWFYAIIIHKLHKNG